MTQKNENNRTPQPKVFDVTRPGSSRPNTSSRPIIVTHRPVVQDPMVTKDQRDDTSAVTKTAPPLPDARPAEKPQPKAVADAMQAESEKQAQQTEPPKTADEPVTVTVAAAGTTIETTTAPMLPSDTVTPTHKPSAETDVSPAEMDTSESAAPSDDAPTAPDSPEPAETPPARPAATQAKPPISKEKASQDIDALLHDDDLETRVLHDLKDVTYDELSPAHAETVHMGHVVAICAIILVIVVVICLDVLLDAGALTIPGLPHTHFINTYQP